jgi:hypothetical protein
LRLLALVGSEKLPNKKTLTSLQNPHRAEFDFGTSVMFAADTLENFLQANRRVASLAACQTSAESPDAEIKRSVAAAILNALRASRTIRMNKTLE